VYGKLMPAADSLACGGLPLGLAHGVKLARAVARGGALTWNDVAAIDSDAARLRREMEAVFAHEWGIGSAAITGAAR
jgi:predicted homoserine dehydrogenase-like protein